MMSMDKKAKRNDASDDDSDQEAKISKPDE